MSFTLRVQLEGLLHFVENERTSGSGSLARLCIVLPKAPKHTANISGKDGTHLSGTLNDAVAIDGHRVVIQFQRASGGPSFSFRDPVLGGSVCGAVHLREMLKASADKNPDIVSPTPPPSVVRSQVLIGEGGSFFPQPTPSPPELDLTKLDGSAPTHIKISEELFMYVEEVEAAWLIVLPLEDSTVPKAVHQITPSGSDALILVSQVCILELPEGEVSLPLEDHDFRFHYLLLSKPPKPLEDMPAPIVTKFSDHLKNFAGKPKGGEVIKPNGCNCAGTVAEARLFDFDRFMTIKI